MADASQKSLFDDTDLYPEGSRGAAHRPRQPGGTRKLPSTQERTITRFAAWLSAQDQIAAPSVDQEILILRAAFQMANHDRTDLLSVGGMLELAGAQVDFAEEHDGDDDVADTVMAILVVLGDYAAFQAETAREDRAGWAHAQRMLGEGEGEGEDEDDEDGDVDQTFYAFAALLERPETVSDADRAAALAKLRSCRAVPDLLDLIGKSRPITQAGVLRLADIQPVASLLGIKAQGEWNTPVRSAERIDSRGVLKDPDVFRVRSMKDVPVLWAWWQVLVGMEILELTTTRVRPGPNADKWRRDAEVPLADMEQFTYSLTGVILIAGIDEVSVFAGMERIVIATACVEMLHVLDPGSDMAQELPADPINAIFRPRAMAKLDRLKRIGLLKGQRGGGYAVPDALRGVVTMGTASAYEIAMKGVPVE